ncbi:protein GrpE [Endomicrobiia bacterium]|uniref:Protein GrpE n=1 Tax=Endomicrobium trichonymphae TaxID=1408204 RepID=B1H008_ENDTX|nr:nucleotide exchange factor GrpE [Candidatus Endomicrobium trichonymphae]GHT08467.1 protein GrpE [Endomicrobiia bacterium]BAG13840.1 chaperone protein GrpE [Candidatus Endomicrobium trichonymphae]BAV58910.1 chaperone protein GrpE [Candidatus Endomicrobium trichonymphae]GHT15743.1 protein GrpE [Endomicrobiia bacterium]GHT25315.1 protein GrpE [Endomicrobiia bacterium]
MENKKQRILIEQEIHDCNYNKARDEKICELEILKQSIEEKKKQAQDYYDQLLRLKADFENYIRRSEKEKKDYLEWGKEKILLKQISIDDVLRQALKSAKLGNNIESIVLGLEMISKEFSKMLKEEGVKEIECDKFDPNICEALEYIGSEEEDGKILEVYQKGYKMNEKLIRAAKVKVAKNNKENIVGNEK